WNVEMLRQLIGVSAKTAGQHRLGCAFGQLNPTLDDVFRHQRGDLYARIDDAPFELCLAEAGQHLFKPWPCKFACQKCTDFSHRASTPPGAPQSRRLVL